jgi:enoyl-CoA hydratase/carnithine racemase
MLPSCYASRDVREASQHVPAHSVFGRKFDGVEAQQLGLAEPLCEPGTAATEATAYIKQLAASAAPMSLMVMKQQVYRHLNIQLGEAMHDTNTLMAASLERDNFREGVRSFIERRPPKFQKLSVTN